MIGAALLALVLVVLIAVQSLVVRARRVWTTGRGGTTYRSFSFNSPDGQPCGFRQPPAPQANRDERKNGRF